ncbi:MAG: hypothetical protein JSS47_16430 [Proteobacteria bacterium]|nr:hypothetical protein [Pseudomonadota bacterium]
MGGYVGIEPEAEVRLSRAPPQLRPQSGRFEPLLTRILESTLAERKAVLRKAPDVRVMNAIIILAAHASPEWAAGSMDASNLPCS